MSVRRPHHDGIALRDLSRYDLLLALLPLPLFVGALVAAATPVAEAVGVGAGSLPSALLLGYAMFGAAPTGERG